ncbi:MAG: hypothetical protein P1V51_04340 [Deltaproteobacteria bacterium]|nr:hypothetical protein [Deltaproteobacteria bacterium]
MTDRFRFLLRRTLEVSALLATAVAVVATTPPQWSSHFESTDLVGKIDPENLRWIQAIEVEAALESGVAHGVNVDVVAQISGRPHPGPFTDLEGSFWIVGMTPSEWEPRGDGTDGFSAYRAGSSGLCEPWQTTCRAQLLFVAATERGLAPADVALELLTEVDVRLMTHGSWGPEGGYSFTLSPVDAWQITETATGTVRLEDDLPRDRVLVEVTFEGLPDPHPIVIWADLTLRAGLEAGASQDRTLLLEYEGVSGIPGFPLPPIAVPIEATAGAVEFSRPTTTTLDLCPQPDWGCTHRQIIILSTAETTGPAIDIAWSLEVGLAGVPDPLRIAPEISLTIVEP